MKKNVLGIGITALLLSSVLAGCKKEKGESNEEEVITTMNLRFTPVGGGTTLVFSYTDPDGPGGASPVADEIELSAGSAYNVSVELLNETVTPAENITEEVEEEAAAHRFYYQPNGASGITVNNLNNDPNGVPLGTTSFWTTSGAGTGQVTVTLRHYPADPPNKAAADPVDSPKSGTDISATFNTRTL